MKKINPASGMRPVPAGSIPNQKSGISCRAEAGRRIPESMKKPRAVSGSPEPDPRQKAEASPGTQAEVPAALRANYARPAEVFPIFPQYF